MTAASSPLDKPVWQLLAEPRFVTALSTVIVGTAVLAFPLRQLTGWAGLVAILVTLLLFAAGSIAASWEFIEWRGLLPISLLLFLGWAAISLIWSEYGWATVGGLAYLLCFTLLGLYVALLRDTIQIVRAFADVLRFTLATSLAVEIISGALIDAPIEFLHVLGRLSEFGPIQGLAGTRNQLGILALVAIVTFATEFRTHTVSRGLSIGSLTLASMTLLLTQSPLAFGALLVVLVAAAALYGLRRAEPERRRFWQLGLLIAAAIAAALAWAFRHVLVDAFNAGGELTYRLRLWHSITELVSLNPLEGWGWVGAWRDEIEPFSAFANIGARSTTSASNAFIDVWFQLGLVGVALFVGLVGLAFVRSWLLASRQRSVVFAWPALILVALVVTALGESSLLIEFGWLTFVACTIKAAQQLSWRGALADAP